MEHLIYSNGTILSVDKIGIIYIEINAYITSCHSTSGSVKYTWHNVVKPRLSVGAVGHSSS